MEQVSLAITSTSENYVQNEHALYISKVEYQ